MRHLSQELTYIAWTPGATPCAFSIRPPLCRTLAISLVPITALFLIPMNVAQPYPSGGIVLS
jgi:hypothetical protein